MPSFEQFALLYRRSPALAWAAITLQRRRCACLCCSWPRLAELIMKRKWKIKIAEDPALNDRPIPLNELQKMEAALLKGEAEAFSQMEAAIVPSAPAPVAGTEKIETPKEPEKTPEQREMERQADILRKRRRQRPK